MFTGRLASHRKEWLDWLREAEKAAKRGDWGKAMDAALAAGACHERMRREEVMVAESRVHG